MTLSVIGVGLGRTGTLSLKNALEHLGIGPCYHMLEIVADPARAAAWTRVGRDGVYDWEHIFAGYRATVDWPAATYWRELLGHYPRAKFILSVRDADAWYESTQRTIFNPDLKHIIPPDTDLTRMVGYCVLRMFGGDVHDRAHAISVFEQHNRSVIETIPGEQLLVYEVGSGWEPICRFLDVPVPDIPYPSENSTGAFSDVVKSTYKADNAG